MKRKGMVLLLLFVVAWMPALSEAVPTISAPFETVGVGDTFTVAISIADAVDLTSWQFDLAFDPAIVQANSLTEGPLLSSFGATLFVPGVIDNTSGLISLVADSYVDLPPYPSGSGVLVDISFTALAQGVSPLTFSNVFLNFLDSGFDVTNGQITVTGVAVPEPSIPALMATGLGLLGILHLARGARGRAM